MARIGKRLNSSHYASSNAYNSPFGIGHHYGSLGGLGGASATDKLLMYALYGAAGGAAYSYATKKVELGEAALYGAAIGALLSLFMNGNNGATIVEEEVIVAANGSAPAGAGASPTIEEVQAALDLTASSPGSCPEGMVMVPADDGTGEMICTPIDTGLPEITWQQIQPGAGPIAIDASKLAITTDVGPVTRKTNGLASSSSIPAGAMAMPVGF